jgi:dipeptidyl aminopeptidase/acylaminoacyl peptidase
MQPEDILSVRSAGDAQPSPDGHFVAFVVNELDAVADTARSSIWIVPSEGGSPRRLTQGNEPRWSPDGRSLAFVSDRGRGAQVWLLRLDGGDAECLTDVAGGVTGPSVWSPDGARIAFTARVSIVDRSLERSPRVIRRLRYLLNGAGYIGDSYWHVFTVAVHENGAPVQLTSGEWHHFNPAWSPDGTQIACITTRRGDWDTEWVWDLFVLREGVEPRRLTASEGTCAAPAWSPDGKWIAYFDNRCPGTAYAKDYELWLIPAAGGTPRNVSGPLDRGCQISQPPATNEPARWSADSSAVFFHVRDGGFFHLYAYNVSTNELQPVVASRDVDRPIAGFIRQGGAGSFAVAASTATRPSEVFARASSDQEWRRLTDLNPEPSFAVSAPRRLVQLSPEGWEVESWLWLPPSHTPGDAPLPAVLYYHGGPHNTVALGFNEQLHLLAAAGYAVVGVNFRGSTGFGTAFADCILHDWGPRELADGLAIIDSLVRDGVIDSARVGVYGSSYGGFMTNLALARCDRFAAGVSMATISGLDSFSYVTDHWESVDWDSGGPPWSNAEYYRTHSPLTYVADIHAPLLIMHGEEDFRCSVAEADQLFGALRKLKRTVELVRYPGSSHGFSHVGPPSHRVDAARRLVDWFRRYL